MDAMKVEIPKDMAFQLCDEIHQKYSGKWWTIAGMWCLGCTLASKGDRARMCVRGAPGYRGCGQVNARFDSQMNKTT